MAQAKWQIKEVIKTLVLAPGVAALAYIATDILYALAVTAGALPAGQPYALIAGAVAFALTVVLGIDDMVG